MAESAALNFSWIESNRNLTFMEFIKTSGDSFSDVTLVSEDLQEFPAHKLVLSACSTFFQKILESRQQEPERLVLFLSSVNSKDLSNILEFIYQGALDVPVDEVDQLMSAGKILNIKGIVNTEDVEETSAEVKPKKRARKKKVRANKDDSPELQKDESGSDVKIEKEESNQGKQSKEDLQVDQTIGLEEEDKTDNTGKDEEITIDEEASTVTNSGVVEELQQNYSKDEILNAYNKMMALKKMKAKEKYRRAKERNCDKCDYTTKNTSNLARHQIKHRE